MVEVAVVAETNGFAEHQPECQSAVEALYVNRCREAFYNVKMRIAMVSPEMAAGWLETKDTNRPCSESFIQSYTRAILDGRWEINGEPIIFSRAGSLIDGQHRLYAVVRAGISAPMLIIEGVAGSAFETIDGGRARTLAGHLAADGEKYSASLASAVSYIDRAMRGYLWRSGSIKLSISELTAVLEHHPGVRDSVCLVETSRIPGGFVSPGPYAALHYLTTSRHNELLAHDFWQQLLTGVNVSEETPVYTLIRTMTANMRAAKKYPISHVMAFIIKAFNATVQGRKLRVLRMGDEEPFPAIA